MSDFNQQIIEEFRANQGKVGGNFNGAPLLLLHSTGARTGAERVNPMMYRPLDDGRVAVFASKGGAPTDPDWFRNLVAHPDAVIEIGSETRRVRARVAEGDERESIWAPHKAEWPGFQEYETKTNREIPVVVLEPVGATS
jgi:deazaflavin-dependent oxidoreductase (nitroreductase family)